MGRWTSGRGSQVLVLVARSAGASLALARPVPPRSLFWVSIVAISLFCFETAYGKGRKNLPRGHSWPPNRAMKKVGKECLERLTMLGVEWKPAKRKRQIATPVVVESMTFGPIKLSPKWRKGPFVLDCHLAEAIAISSHAWFALGVTELRFSSIHDYRKVRYGGGEKDRLSRHALGLAIDVFEVVDISGIVHVVDENYWGFDLFLPTVEVITNHGNLFRTVLSPVRDPLSHDDHFHLEARVEYPKVRKTKKRRRSKRSRSKRSRHRAKRKRSKRSKRRERRKRRRKR